MLQIDSTLVDSLVSQPLPSVQRQVDNLVSWAKAQVGDAQLASVRLPLVAELEAIVGAADAESLRKLLRWAESRGLIEFEKGGREARLTPKAWEAGVHEARPQAEPGRAEEGSKIERGHCPQCGPDRNADIVAAHEKRWDDEDGLGIWSIDTYSILRCRGCHAIYVKRSWVFSEDMDYETDPRTGEEHPVLKPSVTYWPAPAKRRRPDWLDKIEDHTLMQLLDEVYSALDGDQRVLAAIGARTILDHAMVLAGANEADTFADKLKALQSAGTISPEEKASLVILTDAGSAATHRGWRPKPEELATIFDGTEAFLQREFVQKPAVKAMKASVPPKPKRPKK